MSGKRLKTAKKALSLIFVLLLSINSFAAAVSDNDGSAFITKAEFDSLKNNFQSQLNEFNTSIDNKIDEAIASYLSGIKIELSQTVYTVLSDWKNITMRNYELKNEYAVPETNLIYTYYGAGHVGSLYDQFPSAYGLAFVGQGSGGKTKIKAVSLRNKTGKQDYYNDTTKNEFYWDGYITDYEEKISIAKLVYDNERDLASVYSNLKLNIYDAAKLSTIENAYFSSTKEFWQTKWKPLARFTWNGDTGDSRQANPNPTDRGGYFYWGSNYDNSKKENLYELTWHDLDENIINPAWSKCFYKFIDNTIKSNAAVSSMTINKSGTFLKGNGENTMPGHDGNSRYGWNSSQGYGWQKGFLEAHYNPTGIDAQVYDWTRGATSGGKYDIPTLGGLGPIKSSKIFLQKKDFTFNFNKKEYEKTATTMSQGYPILYATKDTKVTWECVFNDIDGTDAVKENGEVKIILSYGEFGDESTSKGGYVQEDGTKGSDEYAFKTKDQKCKMTWTMQADGWIYAKWFPAALTSSASKTADNWSVTMDGQKSNKVSYILKN